MSEKNFNPEDTEVIQGIVVGVDGSEQGLCALKWAAKEAKRRGSILNIVTAYTIPVFAASSMDAGYATLDDQLIRNGAEEVVRQARATITDTDLTVRTYIESGDPSGVLLDLSRHAELIVVGTRGRGGFVGRLLGSVSSALPAHAKCPTVVIPLCLAKQSEDDPQVLDRIVVGVDGSDRARMAVLVAAELASSGGWPCGSCARWRRSAGRWPGCLQPSTKKRSRPMYATKCPSARLGCRATSRTWKSIPTSSRAPR